MSTDIPSFPIELVEAIIDHLHSYKRSLKACSLVAKQWLPSSRFHLLPAIKVNDHNYRKLIDLLESPYCHLPMSVRMLKIGTSDAQQHQSWMHEAVLALSKHFPSVTGLSIERIYLSTLSSETMSLLQTAFSNIETLELYGCRFYTSERHAGFLSSFKNIKDLTTEHCHDSDFKSDAYPLPKPQLPPQIERISIDGQNPKFMQWMEAQKYVHLKHLVTGILRPPNMETFSRILSSCGPSLRSFRFGFTSSGPTTDYHRHLDLSPNTSLNEITVSLGLLRLDSQTLSSMATILSSISSTKLDTIVLRLFYCSPKCLTELDWEALENLMIDRSWGKNLNLKLIDSVTSSVLEHVKEKAIGIAHSRLPHLAGLDLLNVTYHIGSAPQHSSSCPHNKYH